MTHRDRMLAAVRGQPTDRIPWAPRMDLWAISQRARGTLPPRLAGKNMVEVARELGVACHAVGADFTLPSGADLALRALGIDTRNDYPFRVELRGLPIDFSDDGEDAKARITTAAGDVVTHLYRSTQMARDGVYIPFTRRYAINGVNDFDRVARVFEHLVVVPTPENYRAFARRVGETGVAVGRGLNVASPVHLMLHDLCSIDQFYFLYMDERERMYELARRMEPFFDRCLEALAASDAEVVFWGTNYDQDLTPPPFFEREILPWLRKASDRLHAAGKFLLTHCDGENRDLLPLLRCCGFDVAESVCPAPMTRCTLAELRAGFGRGVTIWGGIPSVVLLPEVYDKAAFHRYLDGLFGELGAGDHLILGVSDNVPPDADLDRLDEITRRVETFGPVTPP